MSKLISAAMMMTLAGCGLGAAELAPTQAPSAPHERLKLRPLEAPQVLTALTAEPVALAQQFREKVGGTIEVKGLLAAEGKAVTIIVGRPSCGLEVLAVARGAAVNGVVQVTLPLLPADSELSVILTLDSDGNGLCSEADTMWETALVTHQSEVAAAFDVTSLEARPNWMCWAAEEPIAP